jgi:hypothetical protein
VRLMDMQLGVTLDNIVATVLDDRPDILGVSATFGQHDLLVGLLDAVGELPEPPLVLAGGSLTARNERLVLRRYPWLLIARGAGEPTIADVLAYWHGDLDLTQVRGIGYTGTAHGTGTLAVDHYRKTATVANHGRPTSSPSSTCWPSRSTTEAWLSWNSPGAAPTTARSAHGATRAPGRAPILAHCRGSSARWPKCLTATPRSPAPFT